MKLSKPAKVKLTLEQMRAVLPSVGELRFCTNLPDEINIYMERNFRILKAKVEENTEELGSLQKKYATTNDKGETELTPENLEKLEKAARTLLDEEKDVELYTFTLAQLGELSKLGSTTIHPKQGEEKEVHYKTFVMPLLDILVLEA